MPTTARLSTATTARLVAVTAGLLGIVLCALTPLLPVTQKSAALDWPTGQALSAQTPSVIAPLTAQTPQSMRASIPCSVFSQMGTDGGVALATMPTSADRAAQKSLVVSASATTVTVSFRNSVAASASRSEVGSSRCRSVEVFSDSTGPGAQFVGLGPATTLTPDKRPQVDGVFSTLTTPQVRDAETRGLRVHVDIDNRFATTPSAVKLATMIVGIISIVVALIALARLDWLGGYHRRIGVLSWTRVLAPRVSDMAVTAVLALWLFLGAGTPDDGYILTMGRAARSTGYLPSYFRYFNAPEAPFDWYYSLLAHWSEVSTAGVWMHIPALGAGMLSWFVLSRVLLPRMGAGVRRSGWAIWAAAAIFVAFWLPFNSGLRSEPIIVAGSLVTWWGVEQAIATRRLLPAAVAALTAGLTLALAPHGIIAVALLIVGARPLLRILLARRRESGLAPLLAPILAAAAFTVLVVFRDQTLATVYDAVRIRYTVGPTISWNQEFLRYYFITVTTEDGALTRRVPLLLLLAALFVVLAVMLRRTRIRGVDPGPVWRVIGASLLTMLLLSFTPTKWTIQFGIFAGFAAALAAAATLAVAQSASRSSRNLSVFISGLLFALAAAMAGKNAWPWAYDFGISWFDRAPVVAGKQVSTLFLILAVIAGAVAVWQHLRLDFATNRGLTHAEPADDSTTTTDRGDRRRLLFASSPIAVIAGLMVVCELAVFAKAAVGRTDEFTVLGANLRALGGDTCAMADKVLVETDANRGTLTAADGRSASAALAGDDSVGFSPGGIETDLTPEPGSAKPGQMNVAGSVSKPFTISGGYAGTLGGNGARTVNGSTAVLPFGLDPDTTPVLGSYGYNSGQASLTTDWYTLPARNSTPLLVISAAGAIASVGEDGVGVFGQKLNAEFGRADSAGRFEPIGTFVPIDPGPEQPNRPWRNLRVPMSVVPPRATVMRLVATDNNVNADQWLAVTPPRAAALRTLQSVVGTTTPTLVDFTVAAQFPCQRPITPTAGVMSVPRWRILPDRITALSQSKTWQDADAGGLLAVSDATARADTVPTYLDNDWYRDWGSLERLIPLAPDAATARISTGTTGRWGWSRDGSTRVVSTSDDDQ